MTKPYLVLLRGINVGGKNRVPMAALRTLLEGMGYSKVSTYIASGNVLLESDKRPAAIKAQIERRYRGPSSWMPNSSRCWSCLAISSNASSGTSPSDSVISRADITAMPSS